MGIGQTDQTQIGYWQDRTGRNMGNDQIKQAEIWVLAKLTRPKHGYWLDRPDQNMGIVQTDQTKIWVLARLTKPKDGYWQN